MRRPLPTLVAAAAISLLMPAAALADETPAPSMPPSSPGPAGHAPFEGTRWHLREFQAEDGGIAGAYDGGWVTFADGRLTGSTGCNDITGSYTFDGTTLAIAGLAPAEPSCESDVIAQEMSMLANLPQVTAIAFESARNEYGTNLGLIDGFGQRPLMFTSLEYRQWAPMYDGEEPMPEGYTSIELRDGTVLGQGPCNAFAGPYTLDGTSIVIGPLESTRESCPDLKLETKLLSELELARSYAMETGDLVLFDEQGGRIRSYTDHRGDD